MSEKVHAAPSAHPEHSHAAPAHAAVSAGQADTKDKVKGALDAHGHPKAADHHDAAPKKPAADQHNAAPPAHEDHASHAPHAAPHAHPPEQPLIPTPEIFKDKKTSWPSRKNVIHGVAFAAAVVNPVAVIPTLAALWGASKVANVARKYVPFYERAENGVKNLALFPFRQAKNLATSAYKMVEHPVNSVLLNPARKFILRPSLGVINWALNIPRDILHFVEAKIGIIEHREGHNKIDAAAVAFLGAGHMVKSVIKEMWAHKKTTAVAVALLYGASLTPGGIPAFLTSLSTSFAAIMKGGLSSLGTALAPTAGGTVAAPAAGGGGFMWNTAKWAFGF